MAMLLAASAELSTTCRKIQRICAGEAVALMIVGAGDNPVVGRGRPVRMWSMGNNNIGIDVSNRPGEKVHSIPRMTWLVLQLTKRNQQLRLGMLESTVWKDR